MDNHNNSRSERTRQGDYNMTCGSKAAVRPRLGAAVGICLLAGMALASAASTTQAQSTGVMSREQLQALIDESHKALQNLGAARDQKPPATIAFKRDKRGKALTDDLRQYVLPPDTEKRLGALEDGAKKDLQAGDLPGVQIGLAELRRSLAAEIARYQAIVDYWREPSSQPFVEGEARKSTLLANGIESPNQKEIESLATEFDQQVAAGDFVTAMRTSWPKLTDLRKQSKSTEWQQLISKLDAGGLQGLRSATPTRVCSPATTTSGSDTPNVRPDFPSISDYFPTSMTQHGIKSGNPEVFVIVNAQGCPERSVLVGPSEHEEFDEAGLKLAVAGRYLPAEKDGKPVRGGFYMRLNFLNTAGPDMKSPANRRQ